jgi:hypothetical protein
VTTTGSVDFSAATPNMNFYTFFYDPESSCYSDAPGHESKGRLRIRNGGVAPAYNINLDLYVTFWPPDVYDANAYDRIDTNSITLRIGASGPLLPRIITQAQSGNVHGCFTATNVVKNLRLFIPGPINPGDTLYVDFDIYSCELPQNCPNPGYHFYTHGVSGDISYTNACNQTYNHHFNWSDYTKDRYLIRSALSATGPGTVSNGQNFNYCFSMQDNIGTVHIHQPDGRSVTGSPSHPNNYQITWTITLPPGVVYTGGPISWNGNGSWPAGSISISGSTLTIVFNPGDRPPTWTDFKDAPICIPLQAVCGTPGTYTISATVSYNPNTACNPPGGYCTGINTNFNISINCPIPCPDGIDFWSFSARRISLGLPDDNNDSQPSGTTYNWAQMRLDRLMHTDTAEAFFGARVRATNFPNWQNVWAILEAGAYGDHLLGLQALITIRKGGNAPVYNFTRPVTTSSLCGTAPDCARMAVDLRTSTLIAAGVLPPSFVYQDGDSIEVRLRFRFETNIGGVQSGSTLLPYFYATDLPSGLGADLAPHPLADRYSCQVQSANMELIGWYVTVGGPAEFQRDPNDPWDQNGCALPFWAYYYVSIGPCCANYCSRSTSQDLFPYEYRQWTLPSQIVVNLPTGWSYAGSGDLIYQRTPNCVHQQTGSGSISPVDPNTNPLVFNTLSYFTPHGGTLVPSDDGAFGLLYMRLRPSCQSRANPQRDTVTFTVHFSGRLTASASTNPTIPYTLIYEPPRLQVEALPDLVPVTGTPIEWNVKVSNVSNVTTAINAFLFFNNTQGNLTVTQVIDNLTNTVITPIGDIYPIGNVPPNTDRYFKVRATFSSCVLDTLFARAGWSCAGYPPAASAYACYSTAPRDTLRYIPANPDLLLSSTVAPNPSSLCDTLTVELTLQNGGSSAAYEPFIFLILPPGINYVPGSSEYLFPTTSSWQALADPNIFFIFRIWNLTSQTNPTGITAAGTSNTLRVRFKVVTTCNYTNNLQVRYFLRYKNYCGQLQFRIGASPVVALQNAIIPYSTSISAPNFTVELCQETITYTVSITNLGAGSTTSFDSVRVTFPSGVTYLPGSATGLTNFTTHNPLISTSGGSTLLQWGLQSGHGTGTLMQFSFQVQVGPTLPSGTYTIPIQTLINATQTCGATTCNTFLSTGTANPTITINRPAGLWTGDVDIDWYKPFNWGDCQVPTCAQDVIIPTNPRGGHFPTIHNSPVNGIASCHDITVQPNASLTLTSTGQLDICRHTTFQNNAQLFTQPGARVRFVGSVHQNYTFKGVGSWHHVNMDQALPGRRLILFDHLNLNGTLTLNTGVIDGFTHGRETFAMQPAAGAVTIGNASSYISGVLRRNINTTAIDGWYYLPVGDFPSGRGYELAQLQFDAVPATQQITAAFYLWPGAPPSCAVKTDCGAPFGVLPNLDHGYWTINRTIGPATSYHLRVFSQGYTNASGLSYAIVKRPTGSGAVFDFEGTCEGTPFDQAHQTGRLAVPDFSEFAVAQSTQPLPVQNLFLRAEGRSQAIALHFTSSLTPRLSHYEILRSVDAATWSRLTNLPPHDRSLGTEGTQNYHWLDLTALPGTRYLYQVVAVGREGERVFSNIAEALLSPEGPITIRLYPNPSEGIAWLSASEMNLPIRVIDMTGKVLWQGQTAETPIQLPHDLAAGTYIVEVGHERLRWVKAR